eukprot:TRINITY_DN10050_c0_g1_i4.p1 TRINITY_DN10050_c0_g1~~TRINITY_DN10050_c0_g1_i4.p1  ORF type:complete len:224 (-),score=-24.48 TRINITY_DN10050_c0_g1_i4:147-818(-)
MLVMHRDSQNESNQFIKGQMINGTISEFFLSFFSHILNAQTPTFSKVICIRLGQSSLVFMYIFCYIIHLVLGYACTKKQNGGCSFWNNQEGNYQYMIYNYDFSYPSDFTTKQTHVFFSNIIFNSIFQLFNLIFGRHVNYLIRVCNESALRNCNDIIQRQFQFGFDIVQSAYQETLVQFHLCISRTIIFFQQYIENQMFLKFTKLQICTISLNYCSNCAKLQQQ